MACFQFLFDNASKALTEIGTMSRFAIQEIWVGEFV